MKSIILLFSMVVLLISSAFAQDMQYVSKQSGDTLFVKDDIEYGVSVEYSVYSHAIRQPRSRNPCIFSEKRGNLFCWNNPASSKKYRTIIMGPEQNLKTGSPTMQPPIITGLLAADFNSTGGMNINKDLLVKNIDLEIGNATGGRRMGITLILVDPI